MQLVEGERTINTYTHADLLDSGVVQRFLIDGRSTVSSKELKERLKREWSVEWDEGQVAIVMRALGYIPDEEGNYIIGVQNLVQETPNYPDPIKRRRARKARVPRRKVVKTA